MLPDGLAAMLILAAMLGFTVIVIVFEVAGDPVIQVALDVITHVTASELASVPELNVALLTPAFTPFTFHWYTGAPPPLTGVAVKVTFVPAQILPDGLAAMLTLAGRFVFTDIVTVFEVAGEPVTQVALDVITHVTASALARVVELNVALLVPAFTPFTCH